MAVDFCISLAKCLKGRSEILVRDHKTLSTVERVLSARERLDEVERSTEDDEDNFDDDDDDDEEEEDEDDTIDDKSLDSSSEEVTLDEDVDSFRQRLLLGWDDSNTKMEKRHLDTSPFPSEESISPPGISKLIPRQKIKRHRLASLFGSAEISSKSPDMPQDVVLAVRNHAMPMKDEENIIILNANGPDEMVAVRALVAKYQQERKIILVNCQFSQVPKELQQAEIVYSILPLVVKEKDTGMNLSVKDYKEGPSKVVVLRRYPKDWEIFVDIGNGFQLVETTQSRPTMKAVTDCLQRYLKSI
jgi:hypothetical protein